MLKSIGYLMICGGLVALPLLLIPPAFADDTREPAVRTAVEREFILG